MNEEKDITVEQWASDQIKAIEAAKEDPQEAHELEDAFYDGILKRILNETVCPYARMLAAAGLRTSTIEFPRWTA